MTIKDSILAVLAQTAGPLCDDCLAKLVRAKHRQEVYKNCTSLAAAGLICRGTNTCIMCAKIKKVSSSNNAHQARMSLDVPAGSSLDSSNDKLRMVDTMPWYWEGNIQARLVSYLVTHGYTIRSVAHTASKSPGKDVVALDQSSCELWISVKGYPEKSQNTQARHWFAEAVFDLILYRSENPNVRLAVGLPQGFSTYHRLASRILWLREALPMTIFWVDKAGNVTVE